MNHGMSKSTTSSSIPFPFSIFSIRKQTLLMYIIPLFCTIFCVSFFIHYNYLLGSCMKQYYSIFPYSSSADRRLGGIGGGDSTDNSWLRRGFAITRSPTTDIIIDPRKAKLVNLADIPPGHHASNCTATYDRYPSVVLPEFMILGGLKTGSSYLHNVLAQHPQLLASNTKEYYYFAENMLLSNKSLTYLGSIFPSFSNTTIGKKPFYSPVGELRSIASAPRIQDLFPCMKFIVVLREPLVRAWSHFQMNMREGLISKNLLPNFDCFVWDELDVLSEQINTYLQSEKNIQPYLNKLPLFEGKESTNNHRPLKSEELIVNLLHVCLNHADKNGLIEYACSLFNFVDSPILRLLLSHPSSSLMVDGLYSEAILYWFQFFPRHQFHFIIAEDLFANPTDELRKVHQFLGISDHTYSAETLKTPVLVWGGVDNHNAPGDYGPPQVEDIDGLYTFLNPLNQRLELVTNIPNISSRWDIRKLYKSYVPPSKR